MRKKIRGVDYRVGQQSGLYSHTVAQKGPRLRQEMEKHRRGGPVTEDAGRERGV